MKKLYLKDMTRKQVMDLLQNNNAFCEKVHEYAWEDASLMLDEYLTDIPARYEIDDVGYNRSYVNIEYDTYGGVYCYDSFEEWLDNVQRDYCLLLPEEEKTARDFIKYAKIANKLEYDVTCKEKDFENVIDKYESLQEVTEAILTDRFVAEYTAYDDLDTLADYALGFYIDEYCEQYFIRCDDPENITADEYNHVLVHVNGCYIKAHDEEAA